jgi:hypothetical protein
LPFKKQPLLAVLPRGKQRSADARSDKAYLGGAGLPKGPNASLRAPWDTWRKLKDVTGVARHAHW